MTLDAQTRQCDMCGRAAPDVRMTREHIFAQSLRDTVAESDDHTFTSATGPTVAGLTRTDHHRPVNLMDVTTRTICDRCNNGWMSELEVRANPVLRRLIAGTDHLSADEVDTVRLWGAKTAAVEQMAAARGRDEAPVAAEDRRSIRDGAVPDAWVITATRLDPTWRHHTHRGYAPLDLQRVVGGRETIERFHFTVLEIGCMLTTVTGGPPDSDAAADVCRLAVRHLWRRVPALTPLFDGEAADLGTWHLPSEETLSQLLMEFSSFLLQEN
ncbi:hypothetical protein [Gordonia sp. SND2]|uniref:hypothetical protein n=1 Tax=Gordonia sp. SND2 TaxID=3388659 RepID=UPI00398A6E9E